MYFNAELVELNFIIFNELSDLDLELCGRRGIQGTAEHILFIELNFMTTNGAGSCCLHSAGTSADNDDIFRLLDFSKLHCVFIACCRVDGTAEL